MLWHRTSSYFGFGFVLVFFCVSLVVLEQMNSFITTPAGLEREVLCPNVKYADSRSGVPMLKGSYDAGPAQAFMEP